MNISQLKNNNNNQNHIIFLTTNNSTPIKMKRFSFSNSQIVKQFKLKRRNKNRLKDAIIKGNSSSYNILNETQKYIFKNYKISSLIALLIYEKCINKLFEFIKKRMAKNNFVEIKKKYISFVIEELHIKNKNILFNISEQELINSNVKLFSSNNNINNNANIFSRYKKLNLNSNLLYKSNYNSNSLFQLNKNKSKKEKLLSFNSLNNTELKTNNKSLINSSNIFIQPKKNKNICNTEYISKKKNNINNNINNNGKKNVNIKNNKKIEINLENLNRQKNISMSNGNPVNTPTKNIYYENMKKNNLKEKIINKDAKISVIKNKKRNFGKQNNNEENKKFGNEEKKENNKNLTDIKDNEKNSLVQLNLIKENLEDNLKNMFNFSYGYYLNYERESDSSKSLYKFNNDYPNIKKD